MTGHKPMKEAMTHEAIDYCSNIQDEDNVGFYAQIKKNYPTESLAFPANEKIGPNHEKKSSSHAPNSTSVKMEFSSDDESVFYTTPSVRPKTSDDVSHSSAINVLRDLTNKIASQAKKKYKSVDQISVKLSYTPSKNESFDGHKQSVTTNSLMATVSQVPKLQDLHAAQLRHGTILSAVQFKDLSNLFFKMLTTQKMQSLRKISRRVITLTTCLLERTMQMIFYYLFLRFQ